MNKHKLKPISIDPSKLVIKDNALIMSSYSLSVEEQRLILASIQKSQEQKKPLINSDTIEITLNVQEYAKLYDVSMSAAYKALGKSSNKLYERSIVIKDKGVSRKIRWLQEQASYDSGKVKLVFSNVVSKHIREVVTAQTAYQLAQATQLRTQHSIRLFEIFQTVIDPTTKEGEWEVSIEEFKDILNIQEFYPVWNDLRKKVVVHAVNLINKNTSLKVEWSVSDKISRNVHKIKFVIFEAEQLKLSLT